VKIPVWIRPLFVVAAMYDGVLGLTFLLAPSYPFRLFSVTPPNHVGYVQFPAALLLVFGLMFLRVASDPVRYRLLIPYGIFLKVAYCCVTTGHWILGGVPGMWKPFVLADALMGVLFLWAWIVLRDRPGGERAV
jgi:hypothetical protein